MLVVCTHIINDGFPKYNNRPYKIDILSVVFFDDIRYNNTRLEGDFSFYPRENGKSQQIAQIMIYNIFEAKKEDHPYAYFEISGSAFRRQL